MGMISVGALKSAARRIEMDRAVLFGLLSKIWVFIAGPVSVILIATHFSPSLQGYYYTFATILALQVFVELGLGTVTQQFASHEWARLALDEDKKIVGDPDSLSRLVSIAQISFKWFFFGSAITVVGLVVGGYFFFATSYDYSISWKLPWFTLCTLTGFNILLVPFWSLLEGCNQVKTLYGFRLLLGILMNVAIWLAIVFGAGLWAASIGTVIGLTFGAFFIKLKYWNFFKSLAFSKPLGPRLSWRTHMFPMQWKIAISWICGYFTFSLFTPVLFKYQSAEVAGKFGMTWNIIGTLGGLAGAWLAPQVPRFAIFIAQKKYQELDRLFWKLLKIVFLLTAALSLAAWLFIYFLPHLKIDIATRLASRFLAPLPVAILLAAQVIMVSSTPFSYYMRAHKEEPLMYISILAGLLIGISTFFFGKYYSVVEVALGYLGINILLIPLILNVWYQFKKAKIASIHTPDSLF